MRREQVEPNEIVYGGIIKACCADGQADKVCACVRVRAARARVCARVFRSWRDSRPRKDAVQSRRPKKTQGGTLVECP